MDRYTKNVKEILNEKIEIPEVVNLKVTEAYEKIRNSEAEMEAYLLSDDDLFKDQSQIQSKKHWHRFRRLAVAATFILIVGGISVPVIAAVKHFINGNTQHNFVETIDETGYMTDEKTGQLTGVEICVEQVAVDENSIFFDLSFKFDDDISALKDMVQKHYYEEGHQGIKLPFFNHSNISIDGGNYFNNNYYEDGEDRKLLEQLEYSNFRFENNTMYTTILIELNPRAINEKHTIKLHFEDLNLGSQTIKGAWEYSYEVDGSQYKDQIIKVDFDKPITYDNGAMNVELTQYAVTPNGLYLYGIITEHVSESMKAIAEHRDLGDLRVIVWDDLGNYYLMYGKRLKWLSGHEENNHLGDADSYTEDIAIDPEDFTDEVYTARFSLYNDAMLVNMQEKMDVENVNYLTQWDSNASQLTFALQNVISSWDEQGNFAGYTCEIVTEPVTIDLK